MKSINGRIEAEDGSPTDFTGYHAYLIFEMNLAGAGEPEFLTRQNVHDVCDEDGRFLLLFPDGVEFHNDVATLQIVAPDGQYLADQIKTKSALNIVALNEGQPDRSQEVVLKVDPPEIEGPTATTVPERVRGKLISIDGGQCAGMVAQLIFWSGPAGASEFDTEAYQPLLTVEVGANGQFVFSRPDAAFEKVFATIAGKLEFAIPIKLDENNRIPSTLLLPVEMTDDDCACTGTTPNLPNSKDLVDGGGQFSDDLGSGCNVQFKPNRTLEEFSYCSFVRTTEPEISRHVLTEADLYELTTALNEIATDAGSVIREFSLAVAAIDFDPRVLAAAERQLDESGGDHV